MDDVSAFNAASWKDLAERGVLFARPYLDLTPETARERIDPFGFLAGTDLAGKDVLCLASGGGQQSAVFAVLGANVTVLDLTEAMLHGDRQAAAHYGVQMDIHQGDMRDLSRFADRSFDIVWQPYSINFVPDPRPVLRETARVLRPGGYHHIQFHTPFFVGMDEHEWTGAGYPLPFLYMDGEEVTEPEWEFDDLQGKVHRVRGPRAFRHTLSTMVNELAGLGFVILRLGEEISPEVSAPPGSWEHFTRVCPPWLTLWSVYRPDLTRQI